MRISALPSVPMRLDTFRHEALLYSGNDGFLDGTVPFIKQGVAARQPCLVVVDAPKIAILQEALGRDADGVYFADMATVGANPALFIPAWSNFVNEHAVGGPLRGLGEPITSARTPAQLVECQRHESLLNVAFENAPPWWLLCPYDVDSLDRSVLAEAKCSHPYLAERGRRVLSRAWRGVEASGAPFDAPLPEPPLTLVELPFAPDDLAAVRGLVWRAARDAGLDDTQTDGLILAVNEIATNSLKHGGGSGTLRAWTDDDTVVCEVSDAGHIRDPLAGRQLPVEDSQGGRGLWLANHVCDLVQVRSYASGTVVRLHLGCT